MVISGVLGALSNLCMQKSMQQRGSLYAFFCFQMLLTFIVVTFLYPMQSGSIAINWYVLVSGIITGVSLGLVKYMIAHAVRSGPASLTFTAVNAASVVPGFLIALIVGTEVFPYTIWQALGSICLVIGLFWAMSKEPSSGWIAFALFAFCLQTIFLLFSQVHGFILEHAALYDLASDWFVPIIFLCAAGMHCLIFAVKENRMPTKMEAFWGTLGGLLNGACAFFFMHATFATSGIERSFIFPVFSISLILSCNIWGQFLYGEKVHWRANSLCLVGVFLAT